MLPDKAFARRAPPPIVFLFLFPVKGLHACIAGRASDGVLQKDRVHSGWMPVLPPGCVGGRHWGRLGPNPDLGPPQTQTGPSVQTRQN